MKRDLKLPWILAGYQLFSKHGPEGLNVEFMARNVAKSKSSFYHHFADLEIFIRRLLDYHLERAQIIAEKENACLRIDPELLQVLIDHKEDLLFSRQLRVHRAIKVFENCFEKANESVQYGFLVVWAKELGLSDNVKLAESFYDLTLDNFYLQITEENLNYEWLSTYFKNLQMMVSEFHGDTTRTS